LYTFKNITGKTGLEIAAQYDIKVEVNKEKV
jgi:hypothetical protein